MRRFPVEFLVQESFHGRHLRWMQKDKIFAKLQS